MLVAYFLTRRNIIQQILFLIDINIIYTNKNKNVMTIPNVFFTYNRIFIIILIFIE